MTSLNTSITRLLNIRTPILLAPMSGASGGAHAAQVTRAGGFGFMGPRYNGTANFSSELNAARAVLGISADVPLPIGVGLLGWKLDEPSGDTVELLSLALENRVVAIWLSFGVDLGRWVDFVRQHDKGREVAHKTIVFVLVNSVDEAKAAVNDWNADVLVAQGIEAGGHGSATAPPLLSIVTELLREFPHGPPLVAAGGLANGAHVAALLTLGAAGAVLGTRFLLAHESTYGPAQQAALLAARTGATVRTTALDALRGNYQWPAGIDGRALHNSTVDDIEGGMAMDEVKTRFGAAAGTGGAEGLVVWAGTGVGLMNEIKNAGDIVRELHDEATAHIRAASALLNNNAQQHKSNVT